jgi:hypothetical protein
VEKVKAMFQEHHTEKDPQLWRKLVEREISYIQTRQDFLNDSTDRVALIKKAFQNPSERGTALRFIEYLKLEERQNLFNELVDLASVSHSDIELCRKAILSFPKTWLLANIEKSAESLLQDGTDEEYRRLLELYIDIDRELAQRLARRALAHADPDIREAGEDFQNYLKNRYSNFNFTLLWKLLILNEGVPHRSDRVNSDIFSFLVVWWRLLSPVESLN